MRCSLIASTLLATAACALTAPAAALDCAKPVPGVEETICATPDLKSAEEQIIAAYDAAMKALPAEAQAGLKADQDEWLDVRGSACEDEEGRGECLKMYADQRLAFVAAKPVSGPGLSKGVLPYATIVQRSAEACATRVAVHKYFPVDGGEDGGEAAFNEGVSEVVATNQAEYGAPVANEECSFDVVSTITYASPDLIAAVLDIGWYGGGVRPMLNKQPVVVNLKTAQGPDYATIFGDAATPALSQACAASIRAEKEARYKVVGDEATTQELLAGLDAQMKELEGVISSQVADMNHWLIYADHAEVFFQTGTLGLEIEGDYVCTLPKDLLAKSAPKGWIIP